MEFLAQHPLCALQLMTALVAFAAGFTTYHFGWRRSRRSDQSGTGGQHGILASLGKRETRRGHREAHFPYFIAALVANDEPWHQASTERAVAGTLLA